MRIDALAALVLIAAVGCGGAGAKKAYERGTAALNAGDRATAVREYGEAVRLAPDVPEYHVDLGIALGKSGHYDAAALEFEEALRLRPGYVLASVDLTKVRAAIEGRQAAAYQQR